MTNICVPVFDNDVTAALAKLKRVTQRTGLLREMKRRTFYLPPGECRRLKSARARRSPTSGSPSAWSGPMATATPSRARPPMRKALIAAVARSFKAARTSVGR